METNAERRRKKLEAFCAERSLKAVAEGAGLNWQYIDQAIKKTLLPAKKDGTRGYRKMSDEAFEKIEDAFKLGRGWFDVATTQNPNTATPPGAIPVSAALEVLTAALAGLDDTQRETVGAKLKTLADAPDSAAVRTSIEKLLTSPLARPQAPPEGGIAGDVLARKLTVNTHDFSPLKKPV